MACVYTKQFSYSWFPKEEVINYIKKNNFFPTSYSKDSVYFIVPADDKHIKMTPKFKEQLKAEGLYGKSYCSGVTHSKSLPISMEWLPIYGDANKYVTKWFFRSYEECLDSDLKDPDMHLASSLLISKI